MKNDFEVFLDDIENNPLQGDSLGKDCYKVRMAIASKNKGKSGGARVITCIKIVKEKSFYYQFMTKKNKIQSQIKKLINY